MKGSNTNKTSIGEKESEVLGVHLDVEFERDELNVD